MNISRYLSISAPQHLSQHLSWHARLFDTCTSACLSGKCDCDCDCTYKTSLRTAKIGSTGVAEPEPAGRPKHNQGQLRLCLVWLYSLLRTPCKQFNQLIVVGRQHITRVTYSTRFPPAIFARVPAVNRDGICKWIWLGPSIYSDGHAGLNFVISPAQPVWCTWSYSWLAVWLAGWLAVTVALRHGHASVPMCLCQQLHKCTHVMCRST
jgi:hypothetical protein